MPRGQENNKYWDAMLFKKKTETQWTGVSCENSHETENAMLGLLLCAIINKNKHSWNVEFKFHIYW